MNRPKPDMDKVTVVDLATAEEMVLRPAVGGKVFEGIPYLRSEPGHADRAGGLTGLTWFMELVGEFDGEHLSYWKDTR